MKEGITRCKKIVNYNYSLLFSIISFFIGISFFSLEVKAQNTQSTQNKSANTAELIQQIKTLLPYRSVKLTVDYANLPTTLIINPKNYEALNKYSAYLKQTFENGGFADFSETCFNHIASKKIKNSNDSSFFQESPTSKPVIID